MFQKKRLQFVIFLIFFITGFFAIEIQALSPNLDFYIDSSYDLYGRKEIKAELIESFEKLVVYADKDYFDILYPKEQENFRNSVIGLGKEFDEKIYPRLTSFLGSEPQHSEKIVVLFHLMKKGAGGYFNPGDQYSKYQYPFSNSKNILYLNIEHINSNLLPAYLSHEFVHLITFNQKDSRFGVSEEIWLNELRAEYAITYLGYDSVFSGSNLESRINNFLRNLNIPLTEWTNKEADYGAVNLFAQYLADHYGDSIFSDSLKFSKTGIESINHALQKNGYQDRFADIFTNWTIALYLNDCGAGEKYCYKNKNLKDLKISPQITYIAFPRTSQVITSVLTKNWAGNWQKIVAGSGELILKFEGEEGIIFKIPYIICENNGNCSVDFLALNNKQKGEIIIDGIERKNLTIIPSVQSKISGFNGGEKSHAFSFTVSTKEKEQEEGLKNELLERIALLQREVERLQAQIRAALSQKQETGASCAIYNNLYFGITNSDEVKCLQELLSADPKIYPEGLVTGNFLSLTRSAVIRFQEKYASEILHPLSVQKGTGYVGSLTRQKISQMLF